MNRQTKGFLLVAFSAFCFSILPILGKIAYSVGISPLNLLAWRFIMAAITLWLVAPFLAGKKLRVSKTDLFHFSVQGVVGYGMASYGYFNALTYLNASMVGILLYTYPALVTLFSRFLFKERLSAQRVIIILITFVGSFLVTNILQAGTGTIHWVGIFLGLLAALAYSVFNLYSQKTTASSPPLVVSTYSTTALAIFFTILAPRKEFLNVNSSVIGIALVIGIVSTVLPIITYLSGIKLIGASRAAIISTFEVAFTIILAMIILGDKLSLTQTIGALLIFGGVLALQLQGSESPKETSDSLCVQNSNVQEQIKL